MILTELQFSVQILIKTPNIKFHKTIPAGTELYKDGRTKRHDEANSNFSKKKIRKCRTIKYIFCAKHPYSICLAVFWITEYEIVRCVLSHYGGCMLGPLTTRRLYAGSSHTTEVVCWVLSQRGGCMLGPLTT